MRRVVLVVLLVATAPAHADVQLRPAQDGLDVIDNGRAIAHVALPGPIFDVLRIGTIAYVARGPRGVTAIDLGHPDAPRELTTFSPGRPAVKLAASSGQLLVVVADYATTAYDLSDPANPRVAMIGAPVQPQVLQAPGAPPPGAAPAAPVTATAKVTAVREGWVAIAADRELHVGDRFELRAQDPTRFIDPATGTARVAPSNDVRGVFAIAQASGATGSGPLPRGVIASVGDIAVTTTLFTHDEIQAPALWRGMTRIVVVGRPFLSVDHLGVGMIATATADQFFDIPLRLGVELSPVSLLAQSSREDTPGFVTGGVGAVGQVRANAGYCTDFFDVGLGLGGELEHQGPSSLSIAPAVRLGALDGLHLLLTNGYTLVKKSNGDHQFAFASLVGELAVPINTRVTLVLNGGGASEWAYGTVGINTYLRGSGGPGTWIFHTSLGGAYVNDRTHYCGMSCTITTVSGAGPTVGVGLDRRI